MDVAVKIMGSAQVEIITLSRAIYVLELSKPLNLANGNDNKSTV